MPKARVTKRPVDLVSSHDHEEEERGMLLCDDEPDGLSMPYSSSGQGIPTLPFRRLRPEENLVYYDEIIPDVNRNYYEY